MRSRFRFIASTRIFVLLFLVYGCGGQPDEKTHHSSIAKAYAEQQSGIQVEGQGRVVRILPDDREGSRHQRFIVALHNGHTLLIAHNIDLAPRVTDLKKGDSVTFSGVYEWNSEGGVIHWTHHDPAGHHPAGWIMHGGQKYQ